MKKFIAISALAVICSTALACTPKPNPKDREMPSPRVFESATKDDNTNRPITDEKKPAYPGVRRHILLGAPMSGNYNTEYVHFPVNSDRDESLDYKLELRDDNTFTFNVVTNNISAMHEGHWYSKQDGSLLLFYDEPTEDTAHNVYVSDLMFCDYLPDGKIMIFDNCNVIVLAREQSPEDANIPRLLTTQALI